MTQSMLSSAVPARRALTRLAVAVRRPLATLTRPRARFRPATAAPRHALFFNLDVPARTYLDIAMPLSMLWQNAASRAVFHTYNIQVVFSNARHWLAKPFRIVPSLDRDAWKEEGFLEVLEVREFKEGVLNPRELLRAVVELLQGGWYVECRLNEFYMPCRSSYLAQQSDVHQNLLTGVDLKNQEFTVVGYEEDYGVSPLKFGDFIRAFATPAPKSLRGEGSQYPWWRLLWKWRPRTPPDAWSKGLDIPRIADQVEDYLLSRDSTRRTEIPVRIREAGGHCDEAGVWGLSSYAGWRKYLEDIQRERREVDLRATRALWEHKKAMVDRAAMLAAAGVSLPATLTRHLQDIEKRARVIRFESYQYNQKPTHSGLGRICAEFRSIEDAERRAYPELLQSLRGRLTPRAVPAAAATCRHAAAQLDHASRCGRGGACHGEACSCGRQR